MYGYVRPKETDKEPARKGTHHGDVGEADTLAGTVLSLTTIVRLDHDPQAHTLSPPLG
jgi:hypothetical protein